MKETIRRINDTSLPIIIVNKYELNDKYIEIGSGNEGVVYNYEDKYAIKRFSLFRALEYFYGEKLTRKFEKLEKMSLLKDESFAFPIGLLGFNDLLKEGCYMDLIKFNKKCKDFNYLNTLEDIKIILEYLLKADKAVQRIHTKDVIIGDFKEDNILIDLDNNPIFVDTDNYAFQDYNFDLVPDKSKCLENKYGKSVKPKDNDIYIFTIMALNLLTHNNEFNYLQKEENLIELINKLNFQREIKEGLKLILSDSQNKPYFGEIIKELNPNQTLSLKIN